MIVRKPSYIISSLSYLIIWLISRHISELFSLVHRSSVFSNSWLVLAASVCLLAGLLLPFVAVFMVSGVCFLALGFDSLLMITGVAFISKRK